VTWGAAMLASLSATLDRPGWWILGLTSFLVRGGLLVFLLPIVVLPTPAGLANAVAPTLVGFVFGSPSDSFVALVLLAAVALAVWLLGGGLIAAWIDGEFVALVGASPALGLGDADRRGVTWRSLAAWLMSHVPLLVAISWGVARLVDAIYSELIAPGDVTIHIAIRVALRIPEVIAVVGLAWLAGEAAGGLAVRHLALTGGTVRGALVSGWLDLVRRPSALAILLLTNATVLLAAAPTALAAGFAWERVRGYLADGVDPVVVGLALGAFVAIWLAGLALVGVAVAWRSAAWTFETARRIASARTAVPM